MRRQAYKAAGQDDAEGGQGQRRTRRNAVAFQGRFETAVEQDDGESERSDEIGDPAAVELDAQQPVLAGEEADAQEDEQERSADPPRNEARQRAERYEAGSEKDGEIDKVCQNGRRIEGELWLKSFMKRAVRKQRRGERAMKKNRASARAGVLNER